MSSACSGRCSRRVTYTAGVLAQKPVLRRISSGQATFIGCVIGLIACLPFAGQLVAEAASASAAALAGVIYLGVVPTALAFTTWGYALARVPAGQLGISTYIVPPIAIARRVARLQRGADRARDHRRRALPGRSRAQPASSEAARSAGCGPAATIRRSRASRRPTVASTTPVPQAPKNLPE